MNERIATYQQREKDLQQSVRRYEKRSRNGSLLRLFVFLAGIGLLIGLFTDLGPLAGFLGLLGFITVFGLLINWHLRLQDHLGHLRRLVQINQREQKLLNHEFDAAPNHGHEFLHHDHENAIDLDLFGPYSFFHFANRTGTSTGGQRFANYLLHPATAETIRQRQEAVRELSTERDWRQDFQAGSEGTTDDPEDLVHLRHWITTDPLVRGNHWYQAALWLAPLFTLAGFLAWIWYLPWYAALLFLAPQIIVLRRTLPMVNEIHLQTGSAAFLLERYARLCRQIERLQPQSELLLAQREALMRGGQPASRAIRRLSYLISQLNVRYNFFAIFLNIFGLWDLHWILRLENWKARLGHDIDSWFDALAEIEALQTLATLSYNFPNWAFPVVTETEAIKAENLSHPLLPADVGVPNDLNMPVTGHIRLVTGSNMAGKSTFLRTVGLNIVLAMAGAPVCARSFRLPTLRVFTSMRTKDALHESTSSFFAELKRLKFIIEAVEARPQPEHRPFFLLDEILKGTNSRDRHRGSRALIHQLLKAESAGLIATHDLELGDMAADSDGAIENWCMEVEIRDGELYFDYQLKPGITQSFNATHLMRRMGINIT